MCTDKENTTTFIFMGDPQCSRIYGKDGSYAAWGTLLERALSDLQSGHVVKFHKDPLLVLGGDIVNRGDKNRDKEWSGFFDAQDRIKKHLLMATPVNGAEESTDTYADRFINPGNGPVGHEKEFFSFDYGCCHFIFLDSAYMGNRRKDAYKFIGAWIRSDLAVNRKPVVFAVMHHPAYTLGTSFEDDVRAKAIRDNYMKLLYRYGVDFILCGHQHAYARTKPADGENQVTQIMGVSGGKLFEARDKSNMAVVREQVSAATLFETDGETITLRTIDKEGHVLDEYTQQARPPKKRNCGTCDRFSQCQGTGKYELLEAEEKACRLGDPLRPMNEDGISVTVSGGAGEAGLETMFFSDQVLAGLEKVEIEYSVMRQGKLKYETKRGFRLADILTEAGTVENSEVNQKTEIGNTSAALILTNSRGHQKALLLEEVLHGRCFGDSAEGVGDTTIDEGRVVPAIIAEEDEGYRLIYGQNNPLEYNGRGWMRDIRQIEIVEL